ncbi:hypothetical protein HYPSUDRAFT_209632 [Hypholoma sublateritium FD-334 SS-4]|uniref:Uncharacterized protein n=1 Tax=Hypholoma sublateritium (strain FD-334 SS-4) TaxID=945553 RepID=A0A0D2N268_HYPSF|nr:hypothetical protein HYPSUDRAFT_209632 [Hypholoma sublateritium FD-334 SS-4]
MSHEQDFIALAFVVEASLDVAHEWRTNLISQYCMALLRRLNEANTAVALKIAFVSYATADTVPCPVLTKRFFVDFKTVLTHMTQDIAGLGVGTTNAGPDRPMAALEGIVAALELFDILQGHAANAAPRSMQSHIVHIAGAPPDAAAHPLWNDSTALDDVGWESLPAELTKRNINYSAINLRPRLPRYPELYAASVTGGAAPWFHVRAPHTLLLAPFAAAPSAVGTPKRAGEGPTPERGDAKRQRLQPAPGPVPIDSPKTVPRAIVPVPPPPAPAPLPVPVPVTRAPPPPVQMVQSQQAPQTSPPMPMPSPLVQAHGLAGAVSSSSSGGAPPANSTPPAALPVPVPVPAPPPMAPATSTNSNTNTNTIANSNPATTVGNTAGMAAMLSNMPLPLQRMLAQMRAMQQEVLVLEQQLAVARQVGDAARVETLMRDVAVRKETQIRVAQSLRNQQAAAKQAQMQQQLQQQQQQGAGPSALPAQQQQQTPQGLSPAQNPGSSPASAISVPSSGPLGHVRNTSSVGSVSDAAAAAQLAALPGSMKAQMQKLYDQKRRATAATAGAMGQAGGSAQPFGGAGGVGAGAEQGVQGVQGGGGVGGKQPQTPVWHGALRWNGVGQAGKKEVACNVVVMSMTPHECHAETWPQALQLIPTQADMPMQELQAWLKRVQPALCMFQLQNVGVAEPKANEAYYRALVAMLTTRKQYATAAWMRPSGVHSPNVLIFPVNGVGLAGAFFPLSGMPELPPKQPAMLMGGGAMGSGAGGGGNGNGMPQLLGPNNQPIPLPFDMTPAMIQRLNQFPPARRMETLQAIKARQLQAAAQNQQMHQQQQQMAAHAQELAGGVGGGGFAGPMGVGMGMNMGMGGLPAGVAGQMPLRMGAGAGAGPPGGALGGMSYDIMQSFMQRNAGGGGDGGGMGQG